MASAMALPGVDPCVRRYFSKRSAFCPPSAGGHKESTEAARGLTKGGGGAAAAWGLKAGRTLAAGCQAGPDPLCLPPMATPPKGSAGSAPGIPGQRTVLCPAATSTQCLQQHRPAPLSSTCVPEVGSSRLERAPELTVRILGSCPDGRSIGRQGLRASPSARMVRVVSWPGEGGWPLQPWASPGLSPLLGCREHLPGPLQPLPQLQPGTAT